MAFTGRCDDGVPARAGGRRCGGARRGRPGRLTAAARSGYAGAIPVLRHPADVVVRDGIRISRVRVRAERWALAADPHLSADPAAAYQGFEPDVELGRMLDQLTQTEPEATLINGDLAWSEGLPGDYARLAERLSEVSAGPVVLSAGNHDDRSNLLRQFAPDEDPHAVEKAVTVVETPHTRLVALDSLYRTDVVPGLLGKVQRDLLVELLSEEPDKSTVVAVHHPLGDGDKDLLDADRLLEILWPRRQVKAVLTAHDHVFRLQRSRDLHVLRLPAVGMPFDPSEPTGWIEARFDASGAELRPWTRAGAGPAQRLEWR